MTLSPSMDLLMLGMNALKSESAFLSVVVIFNTCRSQRCIVYVESAESYIAI